MKFTTIRAKMLAAIIPIINIGFILITAIATVSAKNLYLNECKSTMEESLNSVDSRVSNELNSIKSTGQTLAYSFTNTYKSLSLDQIETYLGNVVKSNPMISGSGIWFEPNVYDPSQKYVGPYMYRDGADITLTMDYSNADYDYFNQEYYKIAQETDKPVLTEPYYDQTSKTIMSTCTVPVKNESGEFIGCVTVDITLDMLQDYFDKIKVGDKGNAFLINSTGVYVCDKNHSNVSKAVNIAKSKNESLANLGKAMMTKKSGHMNYTEKGKTYTAYFLSMIDPNWHIAVQVPESELTDPINKLVLILITISVFALALSVVIIIRSVNNISKNVKNVQVFAGNLAKGDFTIKPIEVKEKNELGSMGSALNDMFRQNKDIIKSISDHARNLSSSSDELRNASEKLSADFDTIKKNMSYINDAMTNSGAASEQVNASSEEVNANVTVLSQDMEKSRDLASEISKRASDIEKRSIDSYESANKLSTQFEESMKQSMEKAEIVKNIDEMAQTIASIADQISLLSLNASIEAARAGEQGRGFAVVATEIGKLADDTTASVTKIQDTITEVQTAFGDLTKNAGDILDFIKNKVSPDYQDFVNVGKQYGNDAKTILDTSEKTYKMADSIHQVMNEVTNAIQDIAEGAQTTAESSNKIMGIVEEVSETVNIISDKSGEQDTISSDLANVVQSFRLE
jgi:methyl-accepting chemotaxis protein